MIGHRFRTLRGVLATMLIAAVLPLVASASPAIAAERSGISVVITELTPTVLGDSGDVTLSGEVTNTGKQSWSRLQAYLLIRPTPFADRADLKAEAAIDQGFAGTRIVEVGRFADLGALAPGQSAPFELSIPVDELPITGTDGVYPIGVQILGTSSNGTRSNHAIARATTFLPRMGDDHPVADSTVVWSLLMPAARGTDGRILDVDDFLLSIGPGGQLRNLLNMVSSASAMERGVIVDPALVVAVDDLTDGRDAGRLLTASELLAATMFRDDLVAVASAPSTMILDYDRTDVLALVADDSSRLRLSSAVERATDAVVDEFGLSRNRITWPSANGVSSQLLRTVRERGDDPVLVRSTSLPQWHSDDGFLVGYRTAGGDLPLLIEDDIARGVPGKRTVATFRQQVYADAALASLSGDERHESLVFVNPTHDPGPDAVWPDIDAPYIEPQPLSMITRGARYTGKVGPATATPLSAAHIDALDRAAQVADLLGTAAVDSPELDDELAKQVARLLGIRWRKNSEGAIKAANALLHRLSRTVSSITVNAPSEVTLSSSEGGFPITITNETSTSVSVGLRLRPSNPALHFPDQPPVAIAAGERRTVTVDVDLKEQNVTTVSVQLMTSDGRTFGSSEEFIIRSSRVGVVLWAAMGGAGLFVVLALVRRFGRNKKSAASPAGEPDE